jgi:hypothetical protein
MYVIKRAVIHLLKHDKFKIVLPEQYRLINKDKNLIKNIN